MNLTAPHSCGQYQNGALITQKQAIIIRRIHCIIFSFRSSIAFPIGLLTMPAPVNVRLPQTSSIDQGIHQQNTVVTNYIFSPLPLGQTRLLKLHGGVGRLRCTLLVVDESSPPPYEALSYVWGAQAESISIQLNDRNYFVGQNLWFALLRLRLRHSDRILWVDALVINQIDKKEKGTEVSKMSTRYSLASRTLIWLGQGKYQIEESLRAIADCDVDNAILTSAPGGTGLSVSRHVENVLGVEYWKRAWVVQELMHSAKALILYGTASVSFDQFTKVVDGGVQKLSFGAGLTTFGETRLFIRPGSDQRKEYLRLNSWLDHYCGQRDCTEWRDRIFAYYCCFPPTVRENLAIDYTMSRKRIALDVTAAWIISEKNLEFLSEPGCREEWGLVERVPSWIPNYFGSRIHPKLRLGSRHVSKESTGSFYYRISEDRLILTVKGRWLGTIEQVGKELMYEDAPEGLPTYISNQVIGCKGCLSTLEPGLTALIKIFYGRERIQAKFAEQPEIIQNIAASWIPVDSGDDESTKSTLAALVDLIYLSSIGNRPIFRYAKIRDEVDGTIPFGFGTANIKSGDRLCEVAGCSNTLIFRIIGRQCLLVGNAYMPQNTRPSPLEQDTVGMRPPFVEEIDIC
jgi:hypothetical protein